MPSVAAPARSGNRAPTSTARPTDERGALVALGTVLAVAAIVLAAANRGLTFFGDDWFFLTGRSGLTAHALLEPWNGHLSALPVLAYEGLRAVFGTSSYVPFQALALLAHLATVTMLWLLCRRLVGAWIALAPAAILAVLGAAYADLLWAFQLGYFLSTAFGLAAWWALERDTRRHDVLVAVLLSASLLSASIALGFLVGTAVALAVRRLPWQRWWPLAVPVAWYAIWYVVYGTATVEHPVWSTLPRYVAVALSSALASIVGLAAGGAAGHVDYAFGVPLAVLAVGYVGRRYLATGRLPRLALAGGAAVVVLWVLAALANVLDLRSADQSRYQYASVVFVLLLACALAPRVAVGRRREGAVLLVVLTGWSVGANVLLLGHGRTLALADTAATRARAGALELARPYVPPEMAVGSPFDFPPTARDYFALADAHGSIADSSAQLASEPEPARQDADVALAQAARLRLVPAPDGARAGADCAPSGATLALPPGEYLLRSGAGGGATLSLRRFAATARTTLAAPVTALSVVVVPRDARSAPPWQAVVAGPAGTALCRAIG